MNLIADIGNSYTKLAVFDNGKIIDFYRFSEKDLKPFIRNIQAFKEKYKNIESIIISSVRKENAEFKRSVQAVSRHCVFFDEKTPIPVKNLYKTPETLGKDRLAGIIAAQHIYPFSNIVHIDCGTALTLDFINEKGEYLGGSIAPGLQMRYKSLHHFTDKLPMLSFDENYNKDTGNTTEEAVRAGVQNGIVHEVEGFIRAYSEKYPNLKVTITGGDTFFFEKRIKKQIFAEPNLVLIGLNLILKYNAK